MRIFFTIFAALFLLTKCAVIRETGRTDVTKLDKDNLQKLNSFYLNSPIDSALSSNSIFNSLWYQISRSRYNRKRQPSWEQQTIKLEVISDRRLKASLYLGDSLLKQKTIKGKVKDGYFYKRPFFMVVPLFPVLCGYGTTRHRFGLVENQLVIDHKEHFWFFALLAGNSGNYQRTEIYKHKNDN